MLHQQQGLRCPCPHSLITRVNIQAPDVRDFRQVGVNKMSIGPNDVMDTLFFDHAKDLTHTASLKEIKEKSHLSGEYFFVPIQKIDAISYLKGMVLFSICLALLGAFNAQPGS